MSPAQATACFRKNRSKFACPEPQAARYGATGVVSGPREAIGPRNVLCAPGLPRPSPPQVQMTVSPGILRISMNDIERRPQAAAPAPVCPALGAPSGHTRG